MLTLCLAEQDDTSKVGSSQAKNWSQVVILDSRWHYHVCPYSLCRYSFPLKTQVLKHLYPSFPLLSCLFTPDFVVRIGF